MTATADQFTDTTDSQLTIIEIATTHKTVTIHTEFTTHVTAAAITHATITIADITLTDTHQTETTTKDLEYAYHTADK